MNFQSLRQRYQSFRAMQKQGRHLPSTDTADGEEHTCLNCAKHYVGNFCPNCGQSYRVSRLKLRDGFDDLINIFTNFDRGFLHTCLELCYRPGYMIRDYLSGHRSEYIKPMQLLFLLTTIMLALHFMLFGSNVANVDQEMLNIKLGDEHHRLGEAIRFCILWLANNMAVAYLILVTLLVMPNWLCFHWVDKDKRLNLSEHFFTMVYVGCQLLMIQIIRKPFDYIRHESVFFGGLGIPLLILAWDFKQLFSISYRRSMRLCLTSSILSFVIFITLLIVGMLAFEVATGEVDLSELKSTSPVTT